MTVLHYEEWEFVCVAHSCTKSPSTSAALRPQGTRWFPEPPNLCVPLNCHAESKPSVGFLWGQTHLKCFLSSVSILTWTLELFRLSTSHPHVSPLQSLRRRWSCPNLLTETVWIFSTREIEDGAIPWISICLHLKMMCPGFNRCNNLGKEGLSHIFKICQYLRRNGFSLGFLLNCKAPRSPTCTHL